VSPGEVTLAVNPFDMAWWPFRQTAHLFPNYQTWSDTTVALTIVWLALLLSSIGLVVWRQYGDALRSLPRRRLSPAHGFRPRRA
jgi:hypothetical protein